MDTNSFLGEVAEDILSKWGIEGMREAQIFFPSVRARAHFLRHVSKHVGKSFCAPAWGDVGETMERISRLRRLDPIVLIPHLYALYTKQLAWKEDFVEFYPWGEVLLHDFDQIDKYLVEADRLFANLSDLRDIEQRFNYLDDEKKSLIETAIGALTANTSHTPSLVGRYRTLWNVLGKIYSGLQSSMEQLRGGYDGFVYRKAAKMLNDNPEVLTLAGGVPKRVAFVGFNALNGCELALFDAARDHCNALFYWNRSTHLMNDPYEEGSLFMRSNVLRYPAALPPRQAANTRIRLISTPSSLSQTNAIHDELARILAENSLDRTALLLADETMLMPTLRALPAEITQCNVTMGYPLRSTLVYTLLELIIASMVTYEEGTISRASAANLLHHPYAQRLAGHEEMRTAIQQTLHQRLSLSTLPYSELSTVWELVQKGKHTEALLHALRTLGQATTAQKNLSVEEQLVVEYTLSSIELLKALRTLLQQAEIEETPRLLKLLVPKVFMQAKASFIGEPLEGLQLMGFLESRTLDFERIIIASCNEGSLPGAQRRISFILPSLMKAFGMPTLREREAMYAYYFSSALQRAKEAVLIYVDNPTLGEDGEPSRYVLQRKYFPHQGVTETTAYTFSPQLRETKWGDVPKSGRIAARLEEYYRQDHSAYLSPHAISLYIRCPLAFYFQHVAKIAQPDPEESIELSALAFGQILHDTLQHLYEEHLGAEWGNAHLDTIEQKAEAQLYKELLRVIAPESGDNYTLQATDQIALEVMLGYLKNFFRKERHRMHSVSRIEALERTISAVFPLADGRKVRLGGKIDRIERTPQGLLRIVDYKTGAYPKNGKATTSIEALFHPGNTEGAHMLQVLLYCQMLLTESQSADAIPALCYLRRIGKETTDPMPEVLEIFPSYAAEQQAFCQRLSDTITELLDISIPFKTTTNTANCPHCPYARLCGTPTNQR